VEIGDRRLERIKSTPGDRGRCPTLWPSLPDGAGSLRAARGGVCRPLPATGGIHQGGGLDHATGRPVAYLFTGLPWEYGGESGADAREVIEYAGSRVALVGALTEVMARLNLRELRLAVPWQDVDLLHLLHERGVTGDHIPLVGHTMRIVNFPGLMRDLRPYVRARLTRSQRRGLRFQQEGDRYAIVRGEERLETGRQ